MKIMGTTSYTDKLKPLTDSGFPDLGCGNIEIIIII